LGDGDAGGPILDGRGRLIGISLDRPRVLALTGAGKPPPGPGDFALTATVLRDFLDYYGIATDGAATDGPVLNDAGAVARLRALTVGFECRL